MVYRRPGAADSGVRQCWKDLVLTGMILTIRLMGAGGEAPHLRKNTSPCLNKPACAAARETDESGFPSRWPISPLRKQVNQKALGWLRALEVGKYLLAENRKRIHVFGKTGTQ